MLNNCHNQPLNGKTFLVTRSIEHESELEGLLKFHGGHVLECPTIRIVPEESQIDLDSALVNLESFNWVVFTSQNTVNLFFDRLATLDIHSKVIKSRQICAVGPKTADMLQTRGVAVNLVPDKYTAEGVVEAFSGLKERSGRVLYPMGDQARTVIIDGLKHLGYQVAAPILYRNLMPKDIPGQTLKALKDRQVDCVIFTASSTVINLAQILGKHQFHDLLQGVTVATIGPITTQTCDRLGLKTHIEAPKYTFADLVDEIVYYFNK